MKKIFTKLMLVALVAIFPLSIFAQTRQTKPVERYFYIQAEGGLSVNHTDLANYGGVAFYQDGNFVIDNYLLKNFDGKVGIGYQMGKVLGLNAKFGTATLGGEKHGQRLIGVDAANMPVVYAVKGFEDVMFQNTTFMEGNLNLTINLSNLFFGYNPRRVFNFIPHLGVGGIGFHAGAVNSTLEGNEEILAAKADREWALTVPVGAELNFNLARKLDFFIDYTFTWAGSDGLDQVQKMPDDIQVINDMYSSVNAGLRFKFNRRPCDIEGMAANANLITMRTNPEQLECQDDQVCFDVIFTVPGEYFEKDAVMNITPTFNYAGGQIELEPVTFVGENVQGGDFQVNYRNGGEFTKHYCTPYTEELEHARLQGNPMFYEYNGTIYNTQEEIVANTYFTQGGDVTITEGVIPPVVMTCDASNVRVTVDGKSIIVTWQGTAESFDIFMGKDAFTGTPTVEGVVGNRYVFNDVEAGSYNVYVRPNCKENNNAPIVPGEWLDPVQAEILEEPTPIAVFFFPYQSANLNLNDRNNRIAKKAITDFIASGEPFTGFRIEGFASPENANHANDQLSADRAAAAERAIKNVLGRAANNLNITTNGNGSDIETYINLVQESNLRDKDAMVRAVNNAGSKARQEQEVQSQKQLYNQLERDILPLIRRVEIYLQ